MAAAYKYNGSAAAVLVSRECSTDHENITTQTEIYKGQLSDLTGLNKSIGGQITSLVGGFTLYIQSLSFKTHADGAWCELTLVASNASPNSGGGGAIIGPDVSFDLEWTRVDKDIRKHRAFDSDGSYALTPEEIKQVDDKISGSYTGTLTSSQTELFKRLVKGETAFPIWVPVARKTWSQLAKPTDMNGCGKIESPPASCNAPAYTSQGKEYKYVLMADRCTKQKGRYQRQREWMGFDDADELIYKNA